VSDCLESEKRKIRYEFLNLRNKMDPTLAAAKSDSIFMVIKKLSAYEKARVVMFYLSCGSEVFTDYMVNWTLDKGKTVVVPAIRNHKDGQMYAVKISRLESVCKSVYGIRQPRITPENIVEKDDIDLFFVPGIAFSASGYRTGYGKGYYDRWLKGVPSEKTVGLAYDFQVIDKVPVGKYDVPVGIIVTEKRVLQLGKN